MEKAQFPEARILIADDESSNITLLSSVLRGAGYSNIRSVTDPRQIFAAYEECQPDIILLDLMMPHMTGFEVMERLKAMIPPEAFVPILVLSADTTTHSKQKALSGLATDFLTKPFGPIEALLRIKNLLWTRHLHCEQVTNRRELESIVRRRTADLHAAMNDLRQTQQQVIQQERMHALAEMAGGVAHDLNNALSIILGFGELLLVECEKRPDAAIDATGVRAIVTAAQDAACMVTRLREFNRPAGDDTRHPIDLAVLARQVITLTEPRWKTQARAEGRIIETKLQLEKVPPILGDPAELRETLTNLVFNAVDAMPAGGVITLGTRARNGHVMLKVSDTGTGMPEAVRQRCLEPFFTTKGERGTGLGLAVVYGIVTRHGGTLEVESAVGRGTAFNIRLPVASCPDEFATAQPDAAVELARILVAEHEDLFRDILFALLERDGHSVETARTGADALETWAPESFDVLIVDQTLGDMAGHELVAQIKRQAPLQRVILLSGFGAGDEAETGGADLVLIKPLARETLRSAITKVMTMPREKMPVAVPAGV